MAAARRLALCALAIVLRGALGGRSVDAQALQPPRGDRDKDTPTCCLWDCLFGRRGNGDDKYDCQDRSYRCCGRKYDGPYEAVCVSKADLRRGKKYAFCGSFQPNRGEGWWSWWRQNGADKCDRTTQRGVNRDGKPVSYYDWNHAQGAWAMRVERPESPQPRRSIPLFAPPGPELMLQRTVTTDSGFRSVQSDSNAVQFGLVSDFDFKQKHFRPPQTGDTLGPPQRPDFQAAVDGKFGVKGRAGHSSMIDGRPRGKTQPLREDVIFTHDFIKDLMSAEKRIAQNARDAERKQFESQILELKAWLDQVEDERRQEESRRNEAEEAVQALKQRVLQYFEQHKAMEEDVLFYQRLHDSLISENQRLEDDVALAKRRARELLIANYEIRQQYHAANVRAMQTHEAPEETDTQDLMDAWKDSLYDIQDMVMTIFSYLEDRVFDVDEFNQHKQKLVLTVQHHIDELDQAEQHYAGLREECKPRRIELNALWKAWKENLEGLHGVAKNLSEDGENTVPFMLTFVNELLNSLNNDWDLERLAFADTGDRSPQEGLSNNGDGEMHSDMVHIHETSKEVGGGKHKDEEDKSVAPGTGHMDPKA